MPGFGGNAGAAIVAPRFYAARGMAGSQPVRGALGHVGLLERGDIVRCRFALGLGDGFEDERLPHTPEIARHGRLPPLRHVERDSRSESVGCRATFQARPDENPDNTLNIRITGGLPDE